MFLFAVIALLPGCEERVDLAIPAEPAGILVVDAIITNERKNHVVKLSLPFTRQNAAEEAASGASVFIFEDTTRVFTLTEAPQGSGHYYTPMMRGLSGSVYTLYIIYEGKAYFARDSPMPVEPLEPLNYRADPNGNVLNFSGSGTEANFVEHYISWDHTTGCEPGSTCRGRVIYYDLKTVDVNEMFKPDKELFYFPVESVVIRRKYSVSPAYKAFLRSMLSETEWRGGAFDVQRSNVRTNLSEGATGFFAVTSVVSDTTTIR